jgi:signal transduction histidine kinase/CheY-like chemotaxis protein
MKLEPSTDFAREAGREAELLHALNTASAILQRAAHSEADVFRVFKEEINKLGVNSALTLLDDSGKRLIIQAVAVPSGILSTLEKLAGRSGEGFSFEIERVDVYRQVVESRRTLFVADNTNHLVQMLPEELQPMTRHVIQYFGRTPGIFAPLVIEGRVQGALNVTGPGLIARDAPALEAFANHIAIALEKVRLFTAMQQELYERRQAEEAAWRLQKLESLGHLAGGIAHDFNNLLTAMLAQTSLALAKAPPPSPVRSHIEKAIKAAERATHLTRQLLAYSGRGHFEIRAFNLNKLIQDNLHLFKVALPKSINLETELADSLPPVEGDTSQVQQVIVNLIINAAEAIGENPGMVRVNTTTQEVSESDEHVWQHTGEPLLPGRYVVLEVQDDGRGMDEETLAKIFEPFFTTKFTGRGLGLAAVLGIVRGHKGGLTVESQEGKGSAFQLFFPTSRSDVVASATIARPGKPAGSRPGVILVIDDEAPVREAVTDILELEGLKVITAADGRDGVALYRERQADISLVILDLSMPGLSGEETLLRLQQIKPDVPVLLSSGYSRREINKRLMNVEVAGFLQKPYNASRLLETVGQYLSKK